MKREIIGWKFRNANLRDEIFGAIFKRLQLICFEAGVTGFAERIGRLRRTTSRGLPKQRGLYLRVSDGVARTLNGLGALRYTRDDFAGASKILAEALEIYRRSDKKIHVVGMLQNLGTAAHLQGKLTEAENYLRESMQIAGELGERRWLNQTRYVLGYVCNDKGSYGEASKFFADALTLDPEIGGKDNIAQVLEGLACTAAAQNNSFRALKLAAFADLTREETKTERSPALQKYFDRYWKAARRAVNAEDAARAASEARRMMLDEAVRFALQDE